MHFHLLFIFIFTMTLVSCEKNREFNSTQVITSSISNVCPSNKKEPHWMWVKEACRPSCGHAAHLAGYGHYGDDGIATTEDDVHYYTPYMTSCDALKALGHDDWKSFAFLDDGQLIDSNNVWEAAKNGGVCCVRDASKEMCPSNKQEPHWMWVKEACRPSCQQAAGLAGYKDAANVVHSTKANSCTDLEELGYNDWKSFAFLDDGQTIDSHNVWEVAKNGGVCCVRDTSSSNGDMCSAHQTLPDWKWVNGICRPSCSYAVQLAGYTHRVNHVYSTKANSCTALNEAGYDDWQNFSFTHNGQKITGDRVWEVAENGGVCCVRNIPDGYTCPAGKTLPDWKWVKNACRPSCEHATRLAGYTEEASKIYSTKADSCTALSERGYDDWQNFSFLDNGQRITGDRVWEVAENGGVCCVRNTSSGGMCSADQTLPDWKWVQNVCRPSCEQAVKLAGYTEEVGRVYSTKASSCTVLNEAGYDDWQNFSFTHNGQRITGDRVWEVAENGGVCCVRNTSSGGMCPADKALPDWKWVKGICRPSCRQAVQLAGYTDRVNQVYSKKANSCTALSEGGYDDWQNFSFTNNGQTITGDHVWEVTEKGGVCCVRNVPSGGQACPADKTLPDWKWVKGVCRPSCSYAVRLSGYDNISFLYSTRADSCADLDATGHNDWKNFIFITDNEILTGQSVWEVLQDGGNCCIRDQINNDNICPPEKPLPYWKSVNNLCRPSCQQAAQLAGYSGYGADGQINNILVVKDAYSCEDLTYEGLDDWKDFSFLDTDGQTEINGNDSWEVAEDGGVCCVRGVGFPPENLCPATKYPTDWMWLNNACRPSCQHAAGLAGYNGEDSDVVYVPEAHSCEDLAYLGQDDWKSFYFLDPDDGSTKIFGNDSWEVTQSGGVCCVRGESTLE